MNQMTISLQEQVLKLDITAQTSGKHLAVAIIKAHDILQETIPLAKRLQNNMLVDFLIANIAILNQLQHIVQDPTANNSLLVQSSEIMQQIARTYQEAIVPMLTRLHNLCTDTDNMQQILAITSLGNEVITCSSQINQFSEKFTIEEKIYTIFGVTLMLSSIIMMIALLSRSDSGIQLLTALTVMALGSSVCRKAMSPHAADPSTDLIVTSVKKMEPLIYDIAKNSPDDQAVLKAILSPITDSNVTTTQAVIETQVKKQIEKKIEINIEPIVLPIEEPVQSVTFMDKVKGMLDIFNTKK